MNLRPVNKPDACRGRVVPDGYEGAGHISGSFTSPYDAFMGASPHNVVRCRTCAALVLMDDVSAHDSWHGGELDD